MDQPTHICQTCLGKDKKLVPISVFRHLLSDINLWEIMDNQGDVCLECHRTITKYYSFKTQAAKVQVLLGNIVQASISNPLHTQNFNKMLLDEHKNTKTEHKVFKIEAKSVNVKDCYQPSASSGSLSRLVLESAGNVMDEKDVKVEIYDTELAKMESLDYDLLRLSDDDDELLSEVRKRKPIESANIVKSHSLPILDEEERRPVVKIMKRKRENVFVKYKSVKHSLGTTIKNEAKGDIAKMYTTIVFSEEEIEKIRKSKMDQPNYKQLPYKCENCVLGFKKMNLFDEHMVKHHEKAGPNSCDVCLCRFRTKLLLEKHRRTHFEVHKCNLCEYKTSGQGLIEGHIESKHGCDSVDRIHCQACSEVFSNAEELSRHSEQEHRLACDQCDLTFKRADNLRSHKRKIHSSARAYKCDECKLTFKTTSRLESHIVKHGPKIAKKMAYCQPCGKQFRDINTYRHHLNDSARHATDALKCPVCEVSLYSKVYLKKHMAFYHLNKVEYACNDCGKPFISKFSLTNHLRTQHGVGSATRPHECDECGKKFTTARNLRSHQLIHRPERSKMCALCGDTFKQNAALYNHTKLVHAGEKRKKSCKPAYLKPN